MPIYMKIEGIEGLARTGPFDKQHKLESFGWGLQNSSGGVGSSFAQMGKINVGDVSISKVADKSSALWIQNCTMGKHIAKAEVTFTAGTQQDQKYATIVFHDVLISSYQIGCGPDTFPTESVSLSFAKFETEFAKLDDVGGKVAAGAKFQYDVKAAKA